MTDTDRTAGAAPPGRWGILGRGLAATSAAIDHARDVWADFWHTPVRAERLAAVRILLGFSLLTELLFEQLPSFELLYGPRGVSPAGLHDAGNLADWYWPALLYGGDDLRVLYTLFGLWVAAAACLTLGFFTRISAIAAWLLTFRFQRFCPVALDGADDTLMAALFLLMIAPCGQALSIDAWRRRRSRSADDLADGPPMGPAWPVRLFQIQVAVIYLSTGLAKTRGYGLFEGTWWDGTSVHYALNYVWMSRWSYAQWPLPLWVTAPLTYGALAWEIAFPVLVLFRRTRALTLWGGVLLHLGIWATLEVGWFGWHTVAMYGVWLPAWLFDRLGSGTRKSAG